jgi:hypothetical protein
MNDGTNVADASFVHKVDSVISHFYDDIGEIKHISLRSLFDIFLIKVLYVERHSRHAGAIDYLGDLLSRHLFTRELSSWLASPALYSGWLAQLVAEASDFRHFQNLYEAYRKHADDYLFLTGIFPRAFRRTGLSRGMRRRFVLSAHDRDYYMRWGKRFYSMASQHELAEVTGQRDTLQRLSNYFEIYMDALNEMSDRYIMGFDFNLIADKMLDNFNLYRKTGDVTYLDNARKYAAILKIDPSRFPSLLRRRGRTHIL